MKTLAIAFAGALIVGLGGAAGVSMMRPAPQEPVSDSAKAAHAADSLPKAAAHDSTQGAAHTVADESVRVIDPVDVKGPAPLPGDVVQAGAPAAHSVAPAITPVTVPQPKLRVPEVPAPRVATPAAPAATPTPAAIPEHRIARVFGTMAPRDAAKVLEQMSDADIVIILGNLSDKQMAGILSKLPAQRVATLSKLGLSRGKP